LKKYLETTVWQVPYVAADSPDLFFRQRRTVNAQHRQRPFSSLKRSNGSALEFKHQSGKSNIAARPLTEYRDCFADEKEGMVAAYATGEL